MTMRTLLIACEDSCDACRFSEALRALCSGTPVRIILLQVVEKVFPVVSLAWLGGGLVIPPPPDEAEREWQKARAEEARAQLRHLRSLLPADYPALLRVEHGLPAAQICRVADEEGADLIVLAGHHPGPLRRRLLGRTARGVVDQADCHVLVLGPADEHRSRRAGRTRSQASRRPAHGTRSAWTPTSSPHRA